MLRGTHVHDVEQAICQTPHKEEQGDNTDGDDGLLCAEVVAVADVASLDIEVFDAVDANRDGVEGWHRVDAIEESMLRAVMGTVYCTPFAKVSVGDESRVFSNSNRARICWKGGELGRRQESTMKGR
jgi:hypothetical protein